MSAEWSYPCFECGTDCLRGSGFCSEPCAAAHRARCRQQDWNRAVARRARRVADGKAVCRAVMANGRMCAAWPIRGTDACGAHANDDERAARDYGRALGEMAVGDLDAQRLGAQWRHPDVIEAHRHAGILDELVRQART